MSLGRGIGFLALWVVLIGAGAEDLVVGVVAAALASWTSLRLLPRGALRIRWAPLPGVKLRFLWQSVRAGIDVARRAFSPALPLKLGFIRYHVGFPPGPARNVFVSLTSLLPGTVPIGEQDGAVVYHCLDTDQPVAEELAAEEADLQVVIGESRG
ncbi:MAG: Na+/H+ antiporter subunit E [Deltaproteobacteria bacterium]|nr:Na+/H+ antiporter subunit E [Deltaproteobacteria bacterium]